MGGAVDDEELLRLGRPPDGLAADVAVLASEPMIIRSGRGEISRIMAYESYWMIWSRLRTGQGWTARGWYPRGVR
ncbi:hypothetical protein BJF90_33065 [Pseudonocardia sp. CNS-004]|nr:hypothetical protein BJF90_33065 [Pseudonocardia sp. CNS-004]